MFSFVLFRAYGSPLKLMWHACEQVLCIVCGIYTVTVEGFCELTCVQQAGVFAVGQVCTVVSLICFSRS